MDERARIMRSNERVKSMSATFYNLAAALIAATAARIFLAAEVDLIAVVWLFGVSCLTFIAWKLVDLLEVEEF